jgi:5'-3' exonuclease
LKYDKAKELSGILRILYVILFPLENLYIRNTYINYNPCSDIFTIYGTEYTGEFFRSLSKRNDRISFLKIALRGENMKLALIDANNIGHISYHRAKSIIYKNKLEEAAKNRKSKEESSITKDDYKSIEGMTYLIFFRKLHKLMKIFESHKIVMCWDNPHSSDWRKSIYPEYKSGRNYTEDPIWKDVLFKSIDELRIALLSYPLMQIQIETLEADDIIYCLCRDNPGKETIIVSGDSDLIQICQKYGVLLYHPIKDKYVDSPSDYEYVIMKSIKGDKADDIAGVKDYGEVKSMKLAQQIFKEPRMLDTLTKEDKEIVKRNLQLIDISHNPNLKNYKPIDLRPTFKANLDKIQKFYYEKKLISLIESFDSIMDILS